MTSNNNSSNQALVPEAREALDRFKMEAAQEVDVTSTANKRLFRGIIDKFS